MIIGAICVAAAVVLYVLHPIITGQEALLLRDDDEPTEAESRKHVALLALRDVEYDHATGKLDDEDYASLREELTLEALEAIEAMEAGGKDPAAGLAEVEGAGAEDPLEREIAAYRAALRVADAACPVCERPNPARGRFCAHCGSALAPRSGEKPVADGPSRPLAQPAADRTGSSGE